MICRLLVGLGLGLVLGCGSGEQVASTPQGTYELHCAQCHARAGQPGGPSIGGSRGPDISKIGSKPGIDVEYLVAYIRDPKSAKPGAKLMPAFGDKLSEEQIRELAEWLASHK